MDKKRCFVIMPFTSKGIYPEDHFTKIYDQIFKPAIEEAGYEAYRADENKLSHSIVQHIFENLTKCEMVVCDLSSANPNVLYELGIRHSYDLPVVLLKDDVTDFIFDVSGIKTIQYSKERLYENVLNTRAELTEAIKAAEETSKQGTVLRMIRVSGAIYPSDAITENDKNAMLLNQIYSEIKLISNQQNMSIRNPRLSNNTIKVIEAYFHLKNVLKREPSIEEIRELTDLSLKCIVSVLRELKEVNINVYNNDNKNNLLKEDKEIVRRMYESKVFK